MNRKDIEPLLTPQEVADVLGWHLQSVYRAASQKRIPHTKVGRSLRFRRADINRWLEERSEDAGRRPNAA